MPAACAADTELEQGNPGDGLEDEKYVIPGAILLDDWGPTIETPSRVVAGRPFDVEITTWAACTEPTDAVLEPLEDGIRITPYEIYYNRVCGGIIVRHRHVVEAVLRRPGKAVIRIRGHHGLGVNADLVTVERPVTVVDSVD
jgi:hypothetical protein